MNNYIKNTFLCPTVKCSYIDMCKQVDKLSTEAENRNVPMHEIHIFKEIMFHGIAKFHKDIDEKIMEFAVGLDKDTSCLSDEECRDDEHVVGDDKQACLDADYGEQ